MTFKSRFSILSDVDYLVRLATNKIVISLNKFEQFSIQYKPKAKNYEIIEAQVRMGKVTFTLTILNVLGLCPFAKLAPFNQGNQGQVYLINHENE